MIPFSRHGKNSVNSNLYVNRESVGKKTNDLDGDGYFLVVVSGKWSWFGSVNVQIYFDF